METNGNFTNTSGNEENVHRKINSKKMEISLMEIKMQKYMLQSGKESFQLITDLKESLKDTLKQSKSAQSLVIVMFVITFLFGLSLIAVAVFFGIQGEDVLSIAFGAMGLGEHHSGFYRRSSLKNTRQPV